MSQSRPAASSWAYLAVLTPIIWGTTYILTTEFLPPDRPWLAGLVRSLPTGLVLVLGSPLPARRWWPKLFVLSLLFSSAFFPLLFVAAYRLPGGVASVINSLSPLVVVILSVPLLAVAIRGLDIFAGLLAVAGVALLVLTDQARLDVWGLLAMGLGVLMMSLANVLVKRWGTPPGMSSWQLTGWTFLIGGLTLVPLTLLFEGLPTELTARNLWGYAYLIVFGGIVSYGLWFWALGQLPASAVTFLGLINPVTAAALGWVFLGQSLTAWQLFGAALVLVSVLLGQLTRARPPGRRRPAAGPVPGESPAG